MDFPKLSNFHISKNELKRNINFSGKNKDFHTDTVSNKDSFAPSEKPAKSNVSAYVCGTLGTFGAGAGIFYGIVAKIKKPFIRKNPAKAIEKLIKTLQPENKDLARNAYPVLLENAEALRIKPENTQSIIKRIYRNQLFQLRFKLCSLILDILTNFVSQIFRNQIFRYKITQI